MTGTPIPIEWSRSAVRDLRRIRSRIKSGSSQGLGDSARLVVAAAEILADHPYIGRSGRVVGTRELVISTTPFIIVYLVRDDSVFIVRVLHHAQQWPPT